MVALKLVLAEPFFLLRVRLGKSQKKVQKLSKKILLGSLVQAGVVGCVKKRFFSGELPAARIAPFCLRALC